MPEFFKYEKSLVGSGAVVLGLVWSHYFELPDPKSVLIFLAAYVFLGTVLMEFDGIFAPAKAKANANANAK